MSAGWYTPIPPAATGFAMAHQPLDLPGKIEAVLIPCAIPLTEEAPETVRPSLQGYDAFLLANQGALTVGSDVLAAHARMETLEHWARIRLIARMLRGGEGSPPEQIGRLYAMWEGYGLAGERPGSPYRYLGRLWGRLTGTTRTGSLGQWRKTPLWVAGEAGLELRKG